VTPAISRLSTKILRLNIDYGSKFLAKIHDECYRLKIQNNGVEGGMGTPKTFMVDM
jgi:hypothetical protein